MQLLGIFQASETGRADATWQSELNSSSQDVRNAAETRAIERAKQGDGSAFEFLYNTHKRRIYSLCLRMTGNREEAEDLTQEVFLQMFRKVGTFRGESAFSTWMHRLAVNLVLMRLRKKGLATFPLDEPAGQNPEDSRVRELGVVDLSLAGSVDRVTLERAIQALPAGYRLVFLLHDVEGYEHGEIAGIMGCSVGNSKSQLHKARMKLRELLQMDRFPAPETRK
ncbi:MAG: RNA polymerase sigma factor [Acidobacteria bacterium]|nr:RNA polymerase sigma factor [Acidobacteriota bacterium]